MKNSANRILTTHTGALYRPRDLEEMLKAKVPGERLGDPASADDSPAERRGRRLGSRVGFGHGAILAYTPRAGSWW